MMNSYALIENGAVTNVVVWDGNTAAWAPAEGVQAVEIADGQTVGIGYSYDGSTFVSPPRAPEVTPVPASVTMRQARLALLATGKLDAVAAAIAALPSPQREVAQIEWEFASGIDRASNVVAMLGPALGLDEAAFDALFVAAAQL